MTNAQVATAPVLPSGMSWSIRRRKTSGGAIPMIDTSSSVPKNAMSAVL
jgi:hypothetical protein